MYFGRVLENSLNLVKEVTANELGMGLEDVRSPKGKINQSVIEIHL